MSSPAPKSPELSEKSKKYDRQIRLWGDHGQSNLEVAQVCLINANALGTEILKGLVLPGIGGFTIVDSSIVTEEDIGCNFFLRPSSVGLSRAKCAMDLLEELNPDVRGDYVDDNIESILENNPNFLLSFNVVVACGVKEKCLNILSEHLWQLNIPFIFCRSIGFYGTARLQIKDHCVIETHPDNKQTDLRLQKPFESLKNHLDYTELSLKVPWLVVVYKFLQKWQIINKNCLPKNYKEKSELRSLISDAMTKDEENFEEAITAVNSCFGGGRPSSRLQDIFNDNSCNNLTKDSNIFWILVRAVKDFTYIDNDGLLPLPGIIPDMTASTENYIKLQNIYRSQAQYDADLVLRHCQQLLKELNMSSDLINEKDVQLFCREVATIAHFRGTKISDENDKCPKAHEISVELESPTSLMGLYVAMRAVDRFRSEHGCDPGECHVESDTARLKAIAAKLLSEWGLTSSSSMSDDLAHELCRYGGAEIHSVSAFMGGCIAHELIKIITKQYRPIDNTFIYNGITSETSVYRF